MPSSETALCNVPAGNSRHIQALISLAKVLRSAVQVAKPEQQRVQTVNDFLFNSALDGVNMFKLLRQVSCYCVAQSLYLTCSRTWASDHSAGSANGIAGWHAHHKLIVATTFVCRYAKESKVLFKVAGYADSARQQSHSGLVEMHDQHSTGFTPPTGELYSTLLNLSWNVWNQR